MQPRVLLSAALLAFLGCATVPPPTNATTVLIDEPSLYRVPLFADEVSSVRAAAAEFLESQDPSWRVVPNSAMEALYTAAASMKHPRTKTQCRAAVAPFSLVRWSYADALRAQLSLSCNPGCKIVLTLEPPQQPDHRRSIKRWVAALDGSPQASEWVRAVARLAPEPEAKRSGGLLGSLTMSGESSEGTGAKIEILDVWPYGSWTPKPRFDTAALETCWQSGWRSGGSDRFNLLVDTSGTVTRCALSHRFSRVPGPRFDCLCGALRQTAFESGAEPRRLQVQLMNTIEARPQLDGVRIYVRLDGVRSSDPFAAGTGFASRHDDVRECFVAAPPAKTVALPVQWQVDPTGATTRFSIDDQTGAISEGAAECVHRALSVSSFTCPLDSAPATVSATLVVRPESEAQRRKMDDLVEKAAKGAGFEVIRR